LYAIRPGQTWDYVPRRFRSEPPEQQPAFRLRHLTSRQQAEIRDMSSRMDSQGGIETKVGTAELRTVQFGLVGWDRWRYGDGEEVPFAQERSPRGEQIATLGCLDTLITLIDELAAEILGGQKLTETEQGN